MRNESRPHWSYSALNQYLRCPLQYYFERVLKLPRYRISSGMVLGSAIHKTLAIYHRSLQRGEEVKWGQIRQDFVEIWRGKTEEQTVEYKPKESPDSLIELGAALLTLYLEESPAQEIVAVEQRMMVPLHNSEGEFLETPLLAFIDLVTREEGILKISEFKTSGRAFGELEIETSLQATCYVNAIIETTGEWPTVEYQVLVKTKTPKIQKLKTSRNSDDLGKLGDLVETVERAVSNEIFYPVETPMNCSSCPYRSECREWKPEREKHQEKLPLMQLNGVHGC